MLKIGIITGSTREGRVNLQVANWLKDTANEYGKAEYDIIDIKDYKMPIYEGAVPALFSEVREGQDVAAWSERVASFDGFIFVTPEYNRGITASLKSAIDYLYKEFNNKPAGIVSYGSTGGVIAASALRVILSTPKIATVGTQPAFNLFTDFTDTKTFAPADFHKAAIHTMLDEINLWGNALKTIR